MTTDPGAGVPESFSPPACPLHMPQNQIYRIAILYFFGDIWNVIVPKSSESSLRPPGISATTISFVNP